jgi:hypothetical protein
VWLQLVEARAPLFSRPPSRTYGSFSGQKIEITLIRAHQRDRTHPGKYAEDREHNREAVYYYYCCSVAQALLAARLDELQMPRGKSRWSEELADQLVQRQRPDGSWMNPLVPQREDDPLVATALAGLSLASCRESLTTQRVQAVTEP